LMQEFAQGGELFSLLHNHRNPETGIGGLPENQACFYAACLADALCFLHSKHHLVFRDLKPENVMLNKYGYPVIIDFGYAKFLDADHPKTYTLVGTPRYMSPELILSIGYDFGTDNWSLGVMIYELLSGFNPFEGPLKEDEEGLDEVELFGIVVEDDYVPLPSSTSTEAKDIVAALLMKEPSERMGANDTGELLDHKWFIVNDIDFQSLRRRKLNAPWLPDLEGHLDTRHFENWDHLAANQETCVIKLVYPKLTDREQKRFSGIAD
jgi:serine/threonine protein kinase